MDRPELIGRELTGGIAETAPRIRVTTPGRIAARLRDAAPRVRSRHLFVIDSIGLSLVGLLALLLWADGLTQVSAIQPFLWVAAVVLATRLLVDLRLGLYRRSWRFATVRDMYLLVACTLLGSAFGFAIVNVGSAIATSDPEAVPGPAFWFIEMAAAFAVLAVPRFGIRSASEIPRGGGARSGGELERTLLYGAGWAGVMIARSSQRDRNGGVLPVGFLDDDPDLQGRDVVGLPVYGGLDALERAVHESGARALLITMPRAPGNVVRRIVERARELDLEVRTVPSVTDLIDGSLDASRLRSVRVEDLLRRPPQEGHASGVQDVFEGRTVLITGAAGSIGSELARQVLSLGPARTILVDRSESALYLVQRELEERLRQGEEHRARWAHGEITTRLANVASRGLMQRLFEEERPDVVLHAAAYKHVPMLEDNPSEAVQVNVGGTLSTIAAAEAAGVRRFVLVSTDKAVWPSSVMGASKRLAEMVVADAARRTGRPFASVRFGNVLGSNGSVVPIFQEQLEKGEPLTITDPEMTRYFMTIPEAAWLILDAAVMAGPGDLFVLDMGEPVRILDVARDLARLAGRDPDSVPIKVVGLRKGEKLHEELFYDEERVERTEVPKVLRTMATPPPADVLGQVQRLLALADGTHEEELKQQLHAYVRLSVSRDEQTWQKAPVAIQIVSEPEPGVDPGLAVPARGAAPGRVPAGTALTASRARAAAVVSQAGAETHPVQSP